MSQNSNRTEFMQRAQQAFRVSQLEQGIKNGSLVRLPGTDACLPKAEVVAFETDLNNQGLALVKYGEDKTNSSIMYLPDAINHVLVRPLTP